MLGLIKSVDLESLSDESCFRFDRFSFKSVSVLARSNPKEKYKSFTNTLKLLQTEAPPDRYSRVTPDRA